MAEPRGESLAIRRETAYGLSLQQPPPLTRERFEMLAAMANQLAKARGLIPAVFTDGPDGPAKVLAVLLMAHELQLPFMESVQNMDVIDGKVQMSGEMRLALIRGAGHKVKFLEYTEQGVSINFRRRDTGEEGTFTWSIAQAEHARDKSGKRLIEKPAWQNYPRKMLLWRVVAEASDVLFTDLMHGRVFGQPDDYSGDVDPDSGGIAVSDVDAASQGGDANEGPVADRPRSQPADMSAGVQRPAEAPATTAAPPPAPPGTLHLLARVRYYALVLKRRQRQDKGELLPDLDVLKSEAETSLQRLASKEGLNLNDPKDLGELADLMARTGKEAGLDLPKMWQEAPA